MQIELETRFKRKCLGFQENLKSIPTMVQKKDQGSERITKTFHDCIRNGFKENSTRNIPVPRNSTAHGAAAWNEDK